MNVLFDIGHPAHIHLFKNARKILLQQGNNVHMLVRNKEVTFELCEAYRIPYIIGTRKLKGILGGFIELFQWGHRARRAIKDLNIDVVASIGSPAGSWAALLSGVPHISFNDTETALSQRVFYYPASKAVYTPKCLTKTYGKKHTRYNGIHDLAYLRPEQFQPHPHILDELGIGKEEKFAILRFVSWDATHDIGQSHADVDFHKKLVDIISKKYKVLISSEQNLPDYFNKYKFSISAEKFHDALAFASLVIGDGATTATEAAVLGVPSIYIAPFSGKLGYLDFLKSYGLLNHYKSILDALPMIEKIMNDGAVVDLQSCRQRLLDDTIDVAQFIADMCLQNGLKREANKND